MEIEYKCKVHGELDKSKFIKEKQNSKKGYYLRCKICKFEGSNRRKGFCGYHGVLSAENIRKDGRCAICHRETAGQARKRDRAKYNAKNAQDRLKNPEKWKELYKRQYRKKIEKIGKEKRITQEIARYFGLTVAEYEKMFEQQNHKCAICLQEETRRSRTKGKICRLAVDHCHITGKIRQLLCHNCNLALGAFKDDIQTLQNAINYIKRHCLNA